MNQISIPPLVLASGSPRRRELLEGLGLTFTVRPANVDETTHHGEAPDAYVERLARAKAGHQTEPDALVLAADTTVYLDGEILGKPEDSDDARRMLLHLAGRTHSVATGVALHGRPRDPSGEPGAAETYCAVGISRVTFAPLSPREIDWYVATGEPMDKAGAYAIQGRGALFIQRLEGSYSNVVGLPLAIVYRLAGDLGWDLLGAASTR